MESLSWALFQRCKEMNSLESTGAVIMLQGYSRALIHWMSDFDAMITPGLAQAPLPIGTPCQDGLSSTGKVVAP